MKLVIVDQETSNIGDSFGIIQERQDELRTHVAVVTKKALFDEGYDLRNACAELASVCSDIQEYTVCLLWFIPAHKELHEKMAGIFNFMG